MESVSETGEFPAGSPTFPRVTVAIPALNAADFLAQTIESVQAQTFEDWELIVCDNNSTDNTLDIARRYAADPRIHVITSDVTLPMGDSWNRAMKQGSAPYVKLLCADDLLHPRCLESQISILDRHPDVAVAAARRDYVDADGNNIVQGRGLPGLTGKHTGAEVVARVAKLGSNPIGCPSALMCRRADLEVTGLYDGELPAVMDLDLAVRLLGQGGLYGSEVSLSKFRISPESATATLAGQGDQYRRWLDRLGQDSVGDISDADLRSGRRRSRIEDIKRVLLFRASNSKLPFVSKLPRLVMAPPKDSPTKSARPVITV